VAGPLRISAPMGFGSMHLGAALFGFLKENPGIELTLELDDRFVNILSEGFDAVIRHGPVDDKRIIVKRLASSRRLLVASPDYIKRSGKPASLEALEQHPGILYSNRGAGDWRFRVARKWLTVRPNAVMRVNNGVLMREAAVAGLGIALLPAFFLEESLKKRSLSLIDVGAEAEGAMIYLAYPEHLRASVKIRALAAWLEKTFEGRFSIPQQV
jgi:DNA-binding transcriptional LysR family regulator